MLRKSVLSFHRVSLGAQIQVRLGGWVPFPAVSRCSEVLTVGALERLPTASLKDAAYQYLPVRSYHKQLSVIMSGCLGILTS